MTKKHLEAKRQHHHVWANYLKRWSTNGKEVYYSTIRGKIAFDSVKSIAVERDFYQISPLNTSHIEAIKALSSLSPIGLQKLHTSYLKDFIKIQKLEDCCATAGIKNEEAERVIYATKCNLLENLHSAQENEAREVIESLANREFDALNIGKNTINFINFFGHQISRTKTFRDTVLTALLKKDIETGTSLAKNLSECWWFVSYMLGMNIGADLYATRKIDNHCLLLNDTDIPFITSDQPIINTHTSLQENEISPPEDEHCDFYYPITPSVAYMINKSDRFQRGINQATVDVVNELNIKLAHRANVYIVSNNKDSLKPLLKYVGLHFKNVRST